MAGTRIASRVTTREGGSPKQRLYGGTRDYHLKRRYGVGAKDVDEFVLDQGGVCAICNRPGAQHVDHDHVTDRVRGVLCFNCNGGLGQFGDDTERLARAQLYLEEAHLTRRERGELRELARERAYASRTSAA
jgi:recombination endonuclease VII